MFNHAPEGYICPFCLLLAGIEDEHVLSRQEDIVYRDTEVTAFVNVRQWPGTPGGVLIIPNQHWENLYDLPLSLAAAIHALSRSLALAMKAAYGCPGTSTRQHNEPAGNQEVWHYHLHLFPRYPSDNLYSSKPKIVTHEERARYAANLRMNLSHSPADSSS
jgi:histidine triad (HIT) family protein